MQQPIPYGSFHLLALAIGMTLAVLAAWLLRRVSVRVRNRIILCVGTILILTELYKQLFSYFIVNNGSYDWWIFPFQLCSIPMVICIVAPLLKKGSVQNTLYDFLLSFSLMGAVMALIVPPGMMHDYWTLTLHAFIWHFLIIFVALLLGFSRSAALTHGGFLRAAILYLALCAVALTINFTVLQRVDCQINMFYLGPQISTGTIFDFIAVQWGWQVNAMIYMAASVLGAYLFYLPFRMRNKLNRKFKVNKPRTKRKI